MLQVDTRSHTITSIATFICWLFAQQVEDRLATVGWAVHCGRHGSTVVRVSDALDTAF